MKKPHVVVVGGGTGTYTLLRGLKKYTDEITISAIVTMADSGGSSGKLRDDFGYLPVGDVRQALVALANDTVGHEDLLRKLFLYRYDNDTELSGHNFGNLFLTALTDITGSETEAIAVASKLLRVTGKVIPVTNKVSDLVATYDTGAVVTGEHEIDSQNVCVGNQIVSLELQPEVPLSEAAALAITTADYIVFGPGDLYTSIIANCVVNGFADAVSASAAKNIYILNLVTKPCQTNGLHATQHVSELARYIKNDLDLVVVADDEIPDALLQRYAVEGEDRVVDDFDVHTYEVLRTSVLHSKEVASVSGDTIRRSFIRHDSDRLAKVLMHYFKTGTT